MAVRGIKGRRIVHTPYALEALFEPVADVARVNPDMIMLPIFARAVGRGGRIGFVCRLEIRIRGDLNQRDAVFIEDSGYLERHRYIFGNVFQDM